MISYAQNFEDVILKRALGDVEHGCYIDIGANDPDKDSVSKAFYVEGWRGIHVEPVPKFAKALAAARPDETVIEAAVTTVAGPIEIFNVEDTGLSTGDAEFAERHRVTGFDVASIMVETVTLSAILSEQGEVPIHWLKIDVEGMEKVVLQSWGDAPQRPWIVVVESTEPNSPVENCEDWQMEMTSRDYDLQYFDGLNRYYLHKNQSGRSQFFGPGPNPFDDFTLSSNSPYVGVVKEETRAKVEQELQAYQRERQEREDSVNVALSQAQQEVLVIARELQASQRARQEREDSVNVALSQAQQEVLVIARELQTSVSEMRTEICALRNNTAALTVKVAELSIWPMTYIYRVIVRGDRTPRYLIRRALFQTSGKPRELTWPLVIRSNGIPRAAFHPWMKSAAYKNMRKPYQIPDAPYADADAQGLCERLLLRSNGKPRTIVRRVLFHSSGKPRGIFRKTVIQADGMPTPLLRRWMDSADYIRGPKAYYYDRKLSPQTSYAGPVWRSVDDKDELSEPELTALMNRIRTELQNESG